MKGSGIKVHGLSDFQLSPSRLRGLGARPVSISIQQRGPALSRLLSLNPAKRQKRMAEKLTAGLDHLRRVWPEANITPRGSGRLPWTLDAVLPASEVARIAAIPSVNHVWVHKVKGIRARRAKRQPGFFCVWGRVAIQVEGQKKGVLDVEDRLVLVRARTEEDAKRRLAKRWRDYAEPYLNSQGQLVRWQLIEVLDVYDLREDEIDPSGTEVFSRLKRARMKPAYVWRPRAKGA